MRAPLALLPALFWLAAPAAAEENFITLASTTSTEASGLFGSILPLFQSDTGIEVRVVAVGTGQALRLGRRGDADALLVHARAAEEAFVAEGHGLERFEVMWNDFLIAGPPQDPVGIRGSRDAPASLAKIAAGGEPFVSRGDDSGTHRAELALWQVAGIDPQEASGTWYREAGSGMGATLNTANGMGAYLLVDRGTWLAFRNKSELEVLCEGDARLRNPYGAIVVSPEKHPHVKVDLAQRFVDWLVSSRGQAAIGAFQVDSEILFHPVLAQSPAQLPPAPR